MASSVFQQDLNWEPRVDLIVSPVVKFLRTTGETINHLQPETCLENAMNTMHRPSPDRVRVLTTDEFLVVEKERAVRAFVNRKIAEGLAGRLHGWVMSDILEAVKKRYGKAYASVARDYIIRDVCGEIKFTSKKRPPRPKEKSYE